MYHCVLCVTLSLWVCVLSGLLCRYVFLYVLHSYILGAILDLLFLVGKWVKAHIKNLIVVDCFCCFIIHQQ